MLLCFKVCIGLCWCIADDPCSTCLLVASDLSPWLGPLCHLLHGLKRLAAKLRHTVNVFVATQKPVSKASNSLSSGWPSLRPFGGRAAIPSRNPFALACSSYALPLLKPGSVDYVVLLFYNINDPKRIEATLLEKEN